MKIINLILLIFLFVINLKLVAQTNGKITGKVVDEKSEEPLIGCNVYIEALKIGGAADVNGKFLILNIPPGTYDIKFSMVGYQTKIVEDVKIVSGLTTNLEETLSQSAIQTEEVKVTSFRNPPVQKDLTNKIQSRTALDISQIPINTVNDLIGQQAGVIKQIRTAPVSSLPVFGQFATIPSDGFHFRGGRENETAYYFDGIEVRDALWGDFDLGKVSETLLSSVETFTGTFGPEFGEAMSGVVKVSTYDQSNVKPKFALKSFSDKSGLSDASNNTYCYDFFISTALPFYENLGLVYADRMYSTDGYIFGYIYPEYVNSVGTDKSGTPKKVPMQYTDTQFHFGKAIWKPVQSLNVTLGGYLSKAQKGVYNHYFKYNPYGTPRVYLNDDLGYLKINYVINKNSFLNLSLANYDRNFNSYVYDNFAYYAITPENGTAEFSINGEDWVYFTTFFNRKEIKLDYVWQVNNVHNLSIGSSFQKLRTHLNRSNPDGGTVLEDYTYEPLQIAGFVNDKMEFEEMGMIINLGARFDYIDTRRRVLQNISEISDLSSPLTKEKPQVYITPRLGISFPVADKAAVRFGYGYYYQFPNYYQAFEGTYFLQASGEYRPNPQIEQSPIAQPDIKPEKTINYEFGIQASLTDDISLDVTTFYRKSSDLIGTLLSETNEGKRFQTLGNIDYATVKGIELSIKKSFSKNFSAFFNYTLSKTLVSTSVLFDTPIDESRTFPANWDQPHVFQGNLHFEADNGFGFSLYGSIASGYPYTRSRFDPNGERAPSIHQLDLNLFKNFKFFGFDQQFFIQVNNLTNEKNIWWVYSDSGVAGDDANEATSHDYTNNPSMYGPGRTIQFGIKIWN